MTALIAGLVLFLGIHSVRIVADDFREILYQRPQSHNRPDTQRDAEKEKQQTPP